MDLGVPFCGSHSDANLWTDADKERWEIQTEKRRGFIQAELEGLRSKP